MLDASKRSPNSFKSYLFERRIVMTPARLRNEASPLKNFAILRISAGIFFGYLVLSE